MLGTYDTRTWLFHPSWTFRWRPLAVTVTDRWRLRWFACRLFPFLRLCDGRNDCWWWHALLIGAVSFVIRYLNSMGLRWNDFNRIISLCGNELKWICWWHPSQMRAKLSDKTFTFFSAFESSARSPMLSMPSSLFFRFDVDADVMTVDSLACDESVMLVVSVFFDRIDSFSCLILTAGTFFAGGGIFSLLLLSAVSFNDWEAATFRAVLLPLLLSPETRSIFTVDVIAIDSTSRRIFPLSVGSFIDVICFRAVRTGRIYCASSACSLRVSLKRSVATAVLLSSDETSLFVSSTSGCECQNEKNVNQKTPSAYRINRRRHTYLDCSLVRHDFGFSFCWVLLAYR